MRLSLAYLTKQLVAACFTLPFLMCSNVWAVTAPVGAIPAEFQVDAMGGADYTIPIVVPAGTAGMQPGLSLNYDSHGGDGLLGMGWSLGGLSTITRCPATLAQDGFAGGVNFDVSDRFCLEGQRLIAINGGAYGGNGTEYRTEREAFPGLSLTVPKAAARLTSKPGRNPAR